MPKGTVGSCAAYAVTRNPTPSACAANARPCYVYVLLSENHDRMYIGSSEEPDRRLVSHNAGKVRSTKRYRPWRCVLLEEYADRLTAEKRERYLKSGWGRRWLKSHVGLAT